jgi:hypothetical protein
MRRVCSFWAFASIGFAAALLLNGCEDSSGKLSASAHRVDPAFEWKLSREYLESGQEILDFTSDGRYYASKREFFGDERGSQILEDELLSVQLAVALTGPPQDVVSLPGGAKLLWGCRLHSCDEKGVAILANDKRVITAGLIHSNCAVEQMQRRRGRTDWADPIRPCPELFLTIFTDGSAAAESNRKYIQQWAALFIGHIKTPEVIAVR